MFPIGVDGYWFDLTRTYVVGKPSRKVKRIFDTVREVQIRTLDSIREGTQASKVMNIACDLFKRHGFKTIRGILRGTEEPVKWRSFIPWTWRRADDRRNALPELVQ
jgi:hypothetical protein